MPPSQEWRSYQGWAYKIKQASIASQKGLTGGKGVIMGAANRVEQRWSQRRKVSLQVDVVSQGTRIATSRTRDVGLGGVFLELETIEDAPKCHQDVDLEFHIARQEETIRHRLRAKVVRVDTAGIGLMFKEFDTGTFRALQEIMRFTPAEAAATR